MVISGYSKANQPILNNAANPDFAYAKTTVGQPSVQDVVFQPDPIEVQINVPVPSITRDGVTVDFPPVKQTVTVNPPSITRQITIPSSTVVLNPYECVGVVQTYPNRLCALIKPGHIAMAGHYAPSPGVAVSFYGKDGIVSGVIDSLFDAFGDLSIWALKEPIPGIMPARITSDPLLSWYAGQAVVSFGLVGNRSAPPYNWAPAATTGRILRAIKGTGGVITCTAMLDNGSMAEPGDSGSPNFFILNGLPFYLGSDRKMGSTNEVNMIHPWVSQLQNL